jgi:hypothetical protein
MAREYDPSGTHHVWRALLAEGVSLEELAADHIHNELLEYIESYSGLQKLKLCGFAIASDDHEIAERFFCRALSVHSSTLRSLALEPSFEGIWCFGENNNTTAILDCQKLSDLSIALQWEDYDAENNQRSPMVS